ncbi:MAG: 4-hydroxythreonine-4-phosphate dehydrogenase PdxA [Arachidicoccus sp.]|nr:4-hydroxythreonine-4-phosphate dehydrogenase PdxA [Arachidicoccus sp.]
MSQETEKPIIGITCGDINGIGIEIIIKSLADNRILDICTPIVYANTKSINFYRKILDENFQFSIIKEDGKINFKQPNIVNCWDEDINITPGKLNEDIGKYAFFSLQAAVKDLKGNKIAGLVTAPIHKKTIQSDEFTYSGHTPYLRDNFQKDDVAMLMIAENMRVAVLTEHIPVSEIAQHVTKEAIVRKLEIINESLKKDFDINKPKIAVLGLNPHAGDEGLIGNEEITIIKPAIQAAKQKNILAFGPYSADGFFAHAQYEKFDAVLAMYHDQGLIPFKSLANSEGVNYTAGLPIVRTSPDHGTAFDIAGKGIAHHESFMEAIFKCVDIWRTRKEYDEARKNPLQRNSAKVIANMEDEKVTEEE